MDGYDVLEAFTRIRVAAETHMDQRDTDGLEWSEETVTEVCSHRGLPVVNVIPFNRTQEGRAIGADYLWWFLEETSSACFGMLVQAKRITRAGRWKVDIRHNQGRQLTDLLATARQLEVPAMYGVYTGGLVLRADMPCFHNREPDCLGCRRMAISMISAYQLADVWGSPTTTADLVLTDSLPLENLVDPDLVTGPVADVNLSEIQPGQLRDFLLLDQAGPREVAKRIFKAVCEHRARGFSAATAEPITIPGAPRFPEVPDDTGHFPGPYYRHFLQGLRTSPPPYVRQLQRQAHRDDTMGYVTAVSGPRGPRGPRRPRALRGVDIDGVVLVTL